MKLIHDLTHLRRTRKPVVIAAGFFDGVHLGHQKVIEQAILRAGQIGGQHWALTFDTHPLRVLNPDAAPPLLTSTRHKLILLERLGLKGCILLPFNRRLAETEPEDFARQLLACSPPLVEIVVGRNWHFGQKGRGDPSLLARLSRAKGPKVNITRTRTWKGETISSTRIRAAVLSGRLEQAASMLGRPFSLLGTVTHGKQVGRKLGYPTANLEPQNETLPPLGVYAAIAIVIEKRHGRDRGPVQTYRSVVNFGVRPTLHHTRDRKPVIEVHILDADRDIYGLDMEVFFVARLRNEKKFSSRRALSTQIEEDIDTARTVLKTGIPKKLKESLYRL